MDVCIANNTKNDFLMFSIKVPELLKEKIYNIKFLEARVILLQLQIPKIWSQNIETLQRSHFLSRRSFFYAPPCICY